LKKRALPAARTASQRCARNEAITHTLVMQPEGHPDFRFIPGQFGWLTVWESPFKASCHPFVFSSSAAVSDGRVEMSIRNLGDFTVGSLRTLPRKRTRTLITHATDNSECSQHKYPCEIRFGIKP
jgi:predicted ferric reductase